jgi:hypothetical protein
MSREIYGAPKILAAKTDSPVITYLTRANTILNDLSTAGAAGKKKALNRLAVLKQLVRIETEEMKKK